MDTIGSDNFQSARSSLASASRLDTAKKHGYVKTVKHGTVEAAKYVGIGGAMGAGQEVVHEGIERFKGNTTERDKDQTFIFQLPAAKFQPPSDTSSSTPSGRNLKI